MLLIDRYLLLQFLKSFAIFFTSFTGLFIVIDSFNNLDEFLQYGEMTGSTAGVLFDYYFPRVFTFFSMTSGVLTLIAAMFTVTLLQRNNEMVALLAAGVPQGRIVRPIIAAVAVIIGLSVINREMIIPAYMDQLTRNAQDWMGDRSKSLNPKYDNRTDVLINGSSTVAKEMRINSPNFRLPRTYEGLGNRLASDRAYYQAPAQGRPGGFLLEDVSEPVTLEGIQSISMHDEPFLLMPADTDWLKPNQCFLVTELTFEQLTASNQWRTSAATWDLISALRNRSLDFGADVRVEIHSRIAQPFLDFTLLLLGLPIVLRKEQRNVFLAIGWCLLIVMLFYVVVLACRGLGNNFWLSPALAAMFPLILFVPVAAGMSEPLRS
ncbi:MAG: LptF/LptG family permease [Pirellulaceae bacterium]